MIITSDYIADCLVVFYSPLATSFSGKPPHSNKQDKTVSLMINKQDEIIGVGLVRFKNRTLESFTKSPVYEEIPQDIKEKVEYWFAHKEELENGNK